MQGGIRVSQFNVERILKAFLPEAIPETFAELKIPLKVTATDYFGHKLAVFDDGELHSALAASAAIPAVFRPVTRDGRLLIDGGIYNPVPFDLIENDADIVIWDPLLKKTAKDADELSNAKYTIFNGWELTGWPVTTIRRGEVVWENGKMLAKPGSGKFVPGARFTRPVFRASTDYSQ